MPPKEQPSEQEMIDQITALQAKHAGAESPKEVPQSEEEMIAEIKKRQADVKFQNFKDTTSTIASGAEDLGADVGTAVGGWWDRHAKAPLRSAVNTFIDTHDVGKSIDSLKSEAILGSDNQPTGRDIAKKIGIPDKPPGGPGPAGAASGALKELSDFFEKRGYGAITPARVAGAAIDFQLDPLVIGAEAAAFAPALLPIAGAPKVLSAAEEAANMWRGGAAATEAVSGMPSVEAVANSAKEVLNTPIGRRIVDGTLSMVPGASTAKQVAASLSWFKGAAPELFKEVAKKGLVSAYELVSNPEGRKFIETYQKNKKAGK